jgi:hypothetical protein
MQRFVRRRSVPANGAAGALDWPAASREKHDEGGRRLRVVKPGGEPLLAVAALGAATLYVGDVVPIGTAKKQAKGFPTDPDP